MIQLCLILKNPIHTNLLPSEKNTLEGVTVDVIFADSITFPTVLLEEKAKGQPAYGAWVTASRTQYSEMYQMTPP